MNFESGLVVFVPESMYGKPEQWDAVAQEDRYCDFAPLTIPGTIEALHSPA